MNPGQLFTRAVTMLPDAVRERLDGNVPLDWTALEDLGTGAALDEAARAHRRLPEPVEALVSRLVRDVGIVPADVAAGVERQGAANAWIHWVTVEPDGESYQLRNDRGGDVHTGVRPEAIAGYAALGLELAAMVHDACERWLEAGEGYQATPEDERSSLAQCAVRMYTLLRAQPETITGHPATASLARTLEYAWNTQSAETRAVLACIRLSTAHGARAPRRSHYAPATSHRLHACDAGEIRWLRALAERAGAHEREAGTGEREEETERAYATGEVAVETAAPVEDAGAPPLGSEPEDLLPETEVDEMERAVNHLPGAIRRRLGEAYGAGVSQALARLQNPREVEGIRAEIGPAAPGRSVPRWLEELAAALLADTGARTREGLRTAGMRLSPRPGAEDGYEGSEVETRAFDRLTPVGLVEQVRSSLAFANDAWTGLTALRSAGKESDWTMGEAEAESREFAAGELDTLEAAREIGQTLDRIHLEYTDAHGERAPTALEQAAMTAEALETVGPTIRTTAGWPGAAEVPNPRDPEDVARIAVVAEALHGEIRAIANRFIAEWIAEVQAYGEVRKG